MSLHIEKQKSGNNEYLRLVSLKRMKSSNGKLMIGKKTILSLGALAKHDDGRPDYLKRLRESFAEGRPLIKELEPYVGQAPVRKWTVTFERGDAKCIGEPKRMAPCILDPVFRALGLDELFASVKCASRIRYDLTGIVRLLTYGRIIDPGSKWSTMGQNDQYYVPPVKSTNPDNVYDALDVIYANRKQIVQRMNTCIARAIGRSQSTVFYDVTNFFFETARPDDDFEDADGSVVTGLRKFGVSKENRRQPIVQLGLFLDDNGIPISFATFPGNTLDHHTLRPAMKETVGDLGIGRFVLVADRGMYSGTNMYAVREAGNGYIVSKSLRKTDKAERAWAIDPDGYTVVSENFRHKSRIVKRVVKDDDGKKHAIREKVVVYWSKAFYEREKSENASFMEFLQKLRENPGCYRISSSHSKGLRRFLKKEYVNKVTGEKVNSSDLMPMIDEAKLDEFNELMGYYQIVTSELDMGDREVIEKYHGLTQIEDQFREMKGTLETRPVFVQTPEHIKAHLMVCFMALTMIRIIQR
ncbi:MAG: IS1634 family transposase, partial [Kiritimatiellae bacterium]|nr:IS1634 family transposase [Kiritimatiellia bacterium]